MPTSPRPLALVTGATAGIGAEFVRQLAHRGYDVLGVARDGARLHAAAATLATECPGATLTPLVADLSTEAGIAAVEQVIAERAPVLVVNNAGFGTTGTLVGSDALGQRRMLTLHVEAVHRLTRAALPAMLAARTGGMIVTSSVASFLASGGNVNYCATKAWQRVYVQALNQELAGSGVTVQALCPGFTHTEFHARMGFDQQGRTKGFLWFPAERVVRESLDAFARGRPAVVVPGAIYKGIVFLARHLPLWVQERLTGFYRRDRP